MALETIPFDGSEYADTAQDQHDFLIDAMEEGDPDYLTHVFGIIARARGMTSIAEEVGIPREVLYRALSGRGDPDRKALREIAEALRSKIPAEPHKVAS